jgi:hypothetical protein
MVCCVLILRHCIGLAMLERLSTILEVPLQRLPSREYLSTLFPRIVVTLLSLIAVAYGTLDSSPGWPLYLGIVMFLLSLAYGATQRFSKLS